MNTTSYSGQIIKQDWQKIGKGFLIALLGSAMAYISQEVLPMLQTLDLSGWELIAVTLSSTLVNAIIKWLSTTTYTE